jgi:hypothetical protein
VTVVEVVLVPLPVPLLVPVLVPVGTAVPRGLSTSV